MTLLIFGFLVILVVSFGIIALVLQPGKDQKLLERRIESIQNPDAGTVSPTPVNTLLKKTNVDSESIWVAYLKSRYRLATKLQRLIMQSNIDVTFQTVVLATFALTVLGFLLCYLFIDVLAVDLAVAVLVGSVPLVYISYMRSKRLKDFDSELANNIDMMSNALRAGHSVVGAIGILAEGTAEPAGSEFREVFRQQNFGLPLRDALLEMLNRVPSPDLHVVITAILVQKDTGGNLGEILDRTVFVIRERLRIKGEIRVQTAQGRLTGWVLTLLPILLLFAINIVNPGYSKILLDDPFGRKLVYLGVGLLLLGGLSIRHLVNGIEV